MKFDKFKGISEEREVKEEQKCSLEHLIETGDAVVQELVEYINKNPMINLDDADAFLEEKYAAVKERLGCVHFNETDLRSYILAKANKDETNGDACEDLSVAYGIYTGWLLQLLIERNDAEGKRTKFYIDGNNARFDYLFSLCKKIDCLYLENFKSASICNGAGMNGGNANIIIIKNITGDGLLSTLCEHGGKASLVVAKNCEGDYLFGNMADGKIKAGLVIADAIRGDAALEEFGKAGSIGMVIGRRITGKNALNDVASGQGKLGVLAGIGITAEERVFHDLGSKAYGPDGSLPNGAVGKLLYENVTAKEIASGDDSVIGSKFCKEEQPEEYAKQMHEYRINEILELVDSMEGKTPEEVFGIAEKIQSVYDSIKDKVEK